MTPYRERLFSYTDANTCEWLSIWSGTEIVSELPQTGDDRFLPVVRQAYYTVTACWGISEIHRVLLAPTTGCHYQQHTEEDD